MSAVCSACWHKFSVSGRRSGPRRTRLRLALATRRPLPHPTDTDLPGVRSGRKRCQPLPTAEPASGQRVHAIIGLCQPAQHAGDGGGPNGWVMNYEREIGVWRRKRLPQGA